MKDTNKTSKALSDGNKLVGWLISYQSHERGTYYELRSGKTFIGGGVVEGERLISVDDKNFGTPHAVLKASSDHALMVQDVFSESGTFVRRSGTNDDVSIQGPTEIAHGDWIRFGDTLLFQVCLIHGGSR
jgi:hypothetical protein